jgi:hypothetical protein
MLTMVLGAGLLMNAAGAAKALPVMGASDVGTTTISGPAIGSIRPAPGTGCAPDAVVAGSVCLDRYEASVWRVPGSTTTNAALVRKIQLGSVTLNDLTAGGATLLGTTVDYAPCEDNGQNCANDIYAVSLPSEIPFGAHHLVPGAGSVRQFGQALAVERGVADRANGTPDPGPDNGTTDCNSATGSVTPTGSRSSCVSARGAFDMVGNLPSGWRTGCRSPHSAPAGEASAMTPCASPERAGPEQVQAPWCAAELLLRLRRPDRRPALHQWKPQAVGRERLHRLPLCPLRATFDRSTAARTILNLTAREHHKRLFRALGSAKQA